MLSKLENWDVGSKAGDWASSRLSNRIPYIEVMCKKILEEDLQKLGGCSRFNFGINIVLGIIYFLIAVFRIIIKTVNEPNSQSTTTLTDENVTAVAKIIKENRKVKPWMIKETLNIPKTMVLRILPEDLKNQKLCATFVPHI